MAKLEAKDYRNYIIKVYNSTDVVTVYKGKCYIYFGDKSIDGCIHFVDEYGKHHRIYGNGLVVIDEE